MLPIPSFSQSQTAADGRMQFNNNARRAGFNPKDALRWQMSQQPQPQPMSAPMGIGMMSAGGPFAAAQRGLDRITAPHNFDTGPMSHPRGPAPVIGMTPRGMNAIGGATLEPNLAQNPGMSFGGTHDDGYRIGAGSGDGKFHDTFGGGIADIKKHGPGAGMGRGVAQQMSAPGMMGPPNPNDPYDPLWKQGYADGGMVTGPGGPKDDMVPAMIDGMKPAKLSSGEFVMPAEAVQFFGLDRLNKMKEKAKEGLMQMHAGEDADEHTEPHGMADMREDRAEGENDDPAGYAAGGLVDPEQLKFNGLAARAMLDNNRAMQSPLTLQPVPFLAPWEKDAQAASAREAASGRPAGVRATDWRRFNRSPEGITQTLRAQQMDAMQNREDQRHKDDSAVRWQQEMARMNMGIGLDAMNRAAGNQEWKDRQAVEENYRLAHENTRIGQEAALRAAEEQGSSIASVGSLPVGDTGTFIPTVIDQRGRQRMAGSAMNPKAAPKVYTPEEINAARKAGATISTGDRGTQVTYPGERAGKERRLLGVPQPHKEMRDGQLLDTGKFVKWYDDGSHEIIDVNGSGAASSKNKSLIEALTAK